MKIREAKRGVNLRRVTALAFIANLTITAMADAPTATFGPFPRVEDVGGVQVSVPIHFELFQQQSANDAAIKVRVVADLADLAAKTGAIIDQIPVPRDNCASYKPDNLVVSLDRKSLLLTGNQALLSIGGKVDVWTCVENPVHKTKVEMQMKDIGFGIKTEVPVIVDMGPGDPFKTKVGSQPFDASLPISLVKSDDRSVRMHLGQPDIKLTGQYAFITNGILEIAGIDINEKAGAALQEAIDPEALRLSVPTFEGFDPTVDSASFVDDGGNIAAEVVVSAKLSSDFLFTAFDKLKGLIVAKWRP